MLMFKVLVLNISVNTIYPVHQQMVRTLQNFHLLLRSYLNWGNLQKCRMEITQLYEQGHALNQTLYCRPS